MPEKKNKLSTLLAWPLIVPAAALLLAVLCAFAVVPAYIATATDVAFSESVLPMLLGVLKTLLETLYISLLAAYLVCAVYFSAMKDEKSGTARAFAVCAAIVLIKYGLNLLSSWIFDGTYEVGDLFLSFLPPVLDLLFLLLVLLAAQKRARAYAEYVSEVRRAGKYVPGVDTDAMTAVYPFPKFLSRSHVILAPLLLFACVFCGISVVQRVLTDIAYGAPANLSEIVEIVFAYISDFVTALIAYTAAYFTAEFIIKEKIKAEKAE